MEGPSITFECQTVCQGVDQWQGTAKLPDLLPDKNRKRRPAKLTDAESGLFRQRTDRNLSELAAFLLNNYRFANIGERLALYQHPCWQLIPPKNVFRTLSALLDGQAASDFLSSRQVEEIAARILGSPYIPEFRELPTPDYHVLCCRDNLYDWEDERIIPANSQAMRFSCLAVDAQDIGPIDTPYFDSFIAGTGGDEAFRQLVLEAVGVIVTGFPCKNFFVLEGPPDCGKSQLARFLKGVLGERSCFALNDISQLGDRWTTGQLPGKLLCLCSDVPNKPLGPKAVGTIKQLTGDDPIHGEEKYQTPFVFQNTAKLLFLTNFPLRISGSQVDVAFERRMTVVPFPRSVPTSQQISRLSDYLLDEAGGILWLALQAVKELEYSGGEFTAIERASDYYKPIIAVEPLDRVEAFIKERCVFEPEVVTPVGALYGSFRQFDREGFPQTPTITNATFGKLLRQLALPVREERTASCRSYRGIRLVDVAN